MSPSLLSPQRRSRKAPLVFSASLVPSLRCKRLGRLHGSWHRRDGVTTQRRRRKPPASAVCPFRVLNAGRPRQRLAEKCSSPAAPAARSKSTGEEVAKNRIKGIALAVVTVQPTDSPPVRCKGRRWNRLGSRRGVATSQDERVLNEKRRHRDQPFAVLPLSGCILAELSRTLFEEKYLPGVLARWRLRDWISGCFRSCRGTQIFCRVRCYLPTCSKHGLASTVDAANAFRKTATAFPHQAGICADGLRKILTK